MKILVTGASGTVGSLVCKNLLTQNADVRVLVRNPRKFVFPAGVEVIQGDLSDADTCKGALAGVDIIFLLLTYDGDVRFIQYALEQGVKKIVAVQDGTVYPVETALRSSGIPYVMLHPVEFMKNALVYWQDSIRYEGVARTPFPDAKSAQIHEADIADVASIVIMGEGHEGKAYYMTGPEAITPRSRIEELSKAIGKPVKMVVQTEEEARMQYSEWGFTPELINYAIETSKNPEPYMYEVLPTVSKLTGHPARTFAQWAKEHAEDFIAS